MKANYRLILSVLLLLCITINSNSQSWTDEFQNAIKIYQTQDFVGAVNAYYKARDLAIEQGGTKDKMYFDLLMGMTGPMAYLGMASEQGKIIDETTEYAEKEFGRNSTQYAECLDMKANWHVQYTQDYIEAVRLFTDSYEIKKRLYTPNHRNPLSVSLWYLSWYNAALAKDNPDLADLSFIEKNVELSRQLDGEKSAMFATTLSNTAQSYSSMGEYTKAIEYQSRALRSIRFLTYKGKKESLAQMKIDMGIFQYKYFSQQSDTKLLQNASENISSGIKNFEKIGTWRINLPRYNKDLGLVFLKLKQFDKARTCFQEALSIQYEFYEKDSYINTYLLREIGQGLMDAGLLEDALKYLSEASEILIGVIRTDFKYLSEQEKENMYFTSIAPMIESFNTLVLKDKGSNPQLRIQLYNYRLATKGLIHRNQEKILNLINKSDDAAVKDIYRQWIINKNLFSVKLNNASISTKSLDGIKNDIDKLERALSEKLHQLTFSTTTTYDWSDVRNKLAPSEAAIELIRFRKYEGDFTKEIYYAALILTKNSTSPEIVFLNNGNDLENKYLQEYRSSMQSFINSNYKNDLYTQYWQPVANNLGDIQKIYLSKDGVYNLINLNTLINPATGDFLLKEKDLVTLSRTDEILLNDSPSKSKDAYLFGRPAYAFNGIKSLPSEKTENDGLSVRKRSVNLQNATWTDLPGTEEEVLAINDLLISNKLKSTVYLKQEATESNLRSMNSPLILHIATHGFFSGEMLENEVVEEGGVVFRGSKQNLQVSEKNAMHNSGIVLAGINNPPGAKTQNDDGVLTAFEATTLNLQNTELVVLSACESGLGSLKSGEGVYGLQRSLKIAGADALLISLWSVDDEATSSFMKVFYETYLNSGDKYKAYHNAQKQLLLEYKHPYFWGAFELIGQ
ncbi:CHAT domain-containing protein [Carboxylicivirga caseinilyticus]|uniref:CHAT domain-containing protein n=1 Tax=Carboxylicivirga caseinilyticus TaxID=3417572 RepID=UPI003D34AD56|nr:CHAT domain-containing protein [Marinilabiliaceae bacterium A049]